MKKIFTLLCVLVLTLAVFPAQADTYYVYTANGKTLNLRSPIDNSVIGNIPYGTRLETDNARSTEMAAYVTYGGKSGYVKWEFLVKDPPPARGKSGASSTPAPAAAPAPGTALPTDGDGDTSIQVFNAYIEYLDVQSGQYSEVLYDYDQPRGVRITANLPGGKKAAYWVIDGIRYDFEPDVPKSFTLENVQDSMIIEAVAANGQSTTLLSPSEIQSMRTEDQLLVSAVHSKLCHIKGTKTGAGGWLNNFDFTDDYTNRATKKREDGGQVTIRVRATIPSGKKIQYWLFDDVKIDFSTNVTQFIARTLNVSKTYEPVFNGTAKASATKAPSSNTVNTRPSTPTRTPIPNAVNTRPSTPTPTPAPQVTMYTVSCTNCTFSCLLPRGGYSNARKGSVPAGAEITLTASGNVSSWVINGATLMSGSGRATATVNQNQTITWTINSNTTIVCNLQR